MTLTDILRPVTLREACEDAVAIGFSLIHTSITGITQNLDEFMEELDLSDGLDPKDYVRFGVFIVRLTDAWKVGAEIYELS